MLRVVMYNPEATSKRIFDNSVGLFMAQTCAKYMDKFIPMDTGMLAQNYVVEPYQVTYTQPYALRCFMGESMNFRKDKHPNATARWDQATSKVHGNDIANEVTQYIKQR